MARLRDFNNSEIVIEVGTDRNSNVLFTPLDTVLRGRWVRSNTRLSFSPDSGYNQLPDVPGIYVALDIKSGTLRGVDPLSLDENKDLMAKVAAAALHDQGPVGPWTEIKKRGLSPTKIKSALWRMHELVEGNKARVVRGEMPKPQDILAMDGELELRTGPIRIVDADPETGKTLTAFATPQELDSIKASLASRAGAGASA